MDEHGGEVNVEDESVDIARKRSINHPSVLNARLDELESILDYHFENRCLLVEVLKHASISEQGGHSYQVILFELMLHSPNSIFDSTCTLNFF